MILTTEVLKFLNNEIELIDSNNWEEIYNVFSNDYALYKQNIGNLTDAFIEAGLNPLCERTHIDAFMFFRSDQTVVHVPEGVMVIDVEAFSNMPNLKEIYLPKSLWKIEAKAFANISTNRVIIHYAGTEKEWDQVIKGYYWNKDTLIELEYEQELQYEI